MSSQLVSTTLSRREKIAAKIKNKDLSAIRAALRQAFIRSEYKKAFLDKHRVEEPRYTSKGKLHKKPWVKYTCAACQDRFSIDDINLDHFEKVGSFKSVIDIEAFFFRIWDSYDNFQILCTQCHDDKTAEERADTARKRKISKSKAVTAAEVVVEYDYKMCGLPVLEDADLSEDELTISGSTPTGADCNRLVNTSEMKHSLPALVLNEIHKHIKSGMIVKSIRCANIHKLQLDVDKCNSTVYPIETSEAEDVASLDDLI